MKSLICLCLFCIIECGCSFTRELTPDVTTKNKEFITLRKMKDEREGCSATVVLRDGREFHRTILSIYQDSLVVTACDSAGKDTSIALHDISEVRSRNHFMGGVNGVLLGTLGGVVAGVGLGAALLPSISGNTHEITSGMVVTYATCLGIFGGTVIGIIEGQDEIIRFPSLKSTEK